MDKIILHQHNEDIFNKISPDMAERALMEGNKRFIKRKLKKKDLSKNMLLKLSTSDQRPLAAVITCSDSRVASEIIFDQGLGDIFVVRNAGNIVDSVTVGSIEYAVEELKVPLIVILGHNKCGAVRAAVGGGDTTPGLQTVISNIMPIVENVKVLNKNIKTEDISSKVENANIKEGARRLLNSSLIMDRVYRGEVKLITAKYNLETGEVKILK